MGVFYYMGWSTPYPMDEGENSTLPYKVGYTLHYKGIHDHMRWGTLYFIVGEPYHIGWGTHYSIRKGTLPQEVSFTLLHCEGTLLHVVSYTLLYSGKTLPHGVGYTLIHGEVHLTPWGGRWYPTILGGVHPTPWGVPYNMRWGTPYCMVGVPYYMEWGTPYSMVGVFYHMRWGTPFSMVKLPFHTGWDILKPNGARKGVPASLLTLPWSKKTIWHKLVLYVTA